MNSYLMGKLPRFIPNGNIRVSMGILSAVAMAVFAYFATIACTLRYAIDPFIFPRTNAGPTHENASFRVANAEGNEIRVRRYGSETNRCIVFFPGQHGGVVGYEKRLFHPLAKYGLTVFALSYSGQDGAKGRTRLDQLSGLLALALEKIDRDCRLSGAVFVGRSLGSMAAAFQAIKWQPRGLVLEGISPAFSHAVHVYMRSKWYLRPASALPVSWLLKKDYAMEKALHGLHSIKIIVFQGALDSRTPPAAAKKIIREQTNVEWIEVAGATHADTYIKARPRFVNAINGYFARGK